MNIWSVLYSSVCPPPINFTNQTARENDGAHKLKGNGTSNVYIRPNTIEKKYQIKLPIRPRGIHGQVWC